MIQEIILVGIGIVAGSVITHIFNTYKNIITNIEILHKNLEEIHSNISTPEEMAKKVLSVRLPLNELPPEVYNDIKKEAEQQMAGKTASSNNMEYFG